MGIATIMETVRLGKRFPPPSSYIRRRNRSFSVTNFKRRWKLRLGPVREVHPQRSPERSRERGCEGRPSVLEAVDPGCFNVRTWNRRLHQRHGLLPLFTVDLEHVRMLLEKLLQTDSILPQPPARLVSCRDAKHREQDRGARLRLDEGDQLLHCALFGDVLGRGGPVAMQLGHRLAVDRAKLFAR